MYTIDNLNVMLISELKEIAEGMGINAKKLGKQELVYKILDQQAVTGDAPTKKETTDKKEGAEPERKMRPRRRENVAPATTPTPTTAPTSSEKSSDELIKDLDFEIDRNLTKFEETATQEETPAVVNESNEPRPQPQNQNQPPQQPKRESMVKDFDGVVSNEGVLEIMQDGYGFLQIGRAHVWTPVTL